MKKKMQKRIIKLSLEEMDKLIFCLGYAIGAASELEPEFAKIFFELALTIQKDALYEETT